MTFHNWMLPALLILIPTLIRADEKPAETKPLGDPANLKRVTEDYDVWIDEKRKSVVVDGVICLREGQLEMG